METRAQAAAPPPSSLNEDRTKEGRNKEPPTADMIPGIQKMIMEEMVRWLETRFPPSRPVKRAEEKSKSREDMEKRKAPKKPYEGTKRVEDVAAPSKGDSNKKGKKKGKKGRAAPVSGGPRGPLRCSTPGFLVGALAGIPHILGRLWSHLPMNGRGWRNRERVRDK